MRATPSQIRNFTVVGHQGSGKTSLAEAMLACAGAIPRMGSVEAGNTVSDYHATEKERHISVHASLLRCAWQGIKFNVIDTPGYLDFISEGLGALRVGDFALVVINAGNGPELGTDQVWEYADGFGIPKMIVVNGADRENVDFDKILSELKSRYGKNVFPMTLPIDPGPGFRRVLDVMRAEEVDYATDRSGRYVETAAEGQWKERVKTLHAELIELVAETDETLLQTFFDQGGLTEAQLRSGVHAAIQAQTFVPVFVTSAINNVGVARLMDMIAKYGSSPIDRREVPATDESGVEATIGLEDADPACYIWKTISEPHVGELSFCRMYAGEIRPGMDLYNSNRRASERIGQVFELQGHDRSLVESIGPGDIGVMAKLRNTHTGDTLCSPNRRVKLRAVEFPRPNIRGALVSKHRGDEDKMAAGLATLREEDPTFIFEYSQETGELVASGQGELHLEILKARLLRRFNVEVDIVQPRIAFRESIRKPADAKYRHKKQSGGAGQFAEVWLRIEPAPRDSGIVFTQSLVGQNVDRVFVPSVEKGIQSLCTEGILAGFHVTDVAVDFYDGKMHPVDSKDIAFQIAGKEAFREAFKQADPCLLEPIMSVDIKVPEASLGDVLSDISARRGHIQGVDMDGRFRVVKAFIPQVELYRYGTTLRSLTGGMGLHQESFARYDTLPPEIENRILRGADKQQAAGRG